MALTNSPNYQTVLFLRAIISSDYNTTRNNVNQMIWPDYPRKDLAKNSYPRVSVMTVTETGEPVCIGGTQKQEFTYILQLDIWYWDKPNDALFVTVSSNTYSSFAGLDRVTRDVIDLMRRNFYSDSNMTGYFDYRVRAVRDIPFDENIGILRKQIEIEFKEYATSTS